MLKERINYYIDLINMKGAYIISAKIEYDITRNKYFEIRNDLRKLKKELNNSNKEIIEILKSKL